MIFVLREAFKVLSVTRVLVMMKAVKLFHYLKTLSESIYTRFHLIIIIIIPNILCERRPE